LSEIEFGTLLELDSVGTILGDFVSAFISGDEVGWEFLASDILERLQGLEISEFGKENPGGGLSNSIRLRMKISGIEYRMMPRVMPCKVRSAR
jgi:hypothetical protein